MTTTSATLDISTRVDLPAAGGHDSDAARRRLQAVAHWIGYAGGAVSRWCRAGQLGASDSVDLARWSGARR